MGEKKKHSKKMGRPPKEINKAEFVKLCKFQTTKAEAASWFSCDEDTIDAWCKRTFGESFSVIFDRYRGQGKVSLRRKQNQIALAGNVRMLIFLGKNYLDQSDKVKHVGDVDSPLMVQLVMPDKYPLTTPAQP